MRCAQCGKTADEKATDWRAYRVDEPGGGELPELAFYCPVCAYTEFGAWPRPMKCYGCGNPIRAGMRGLALDLVNGDDTIPGGSARLVLYCPACAKRADRTQG